MNTRNVNIPDIDDLDALCRAIDWAQYQSMLEQSLANEKIWELGCMDGYNPHTDNIAQIEEELNFLSAGEYEAIELLSKYFEVRSDDHFFKNALFGMPNTLVSNCCYPTQQIAYFAKIIPLHFNDLEAAIKEAFAARERFRKYEQENQE